MKKVISIASILVVVAIGLGIGWVLTNSEVSSLKQDIADLQRNLDELQDNYNDFRQDYNTLNLNYEDLQQRYTKLEENLKPSFPFGSTDDQLFAWVMLRLELKTYYLQNFNAFVDNYNPWDKIQCQYYQEAIKSLGRNLENIKAGANSVYLLGCEKLEEVIKWDLRGIDNDMKYFETWSLTYYNLALDCHNNANAIEKEVLRLLWEFEV